MPLERTVLFAGVFAYFNVNKFGRALRRNGMKTVFLSLNPSNSLHHQGCHDLVLDAAGCLDLFYELISEPRFRVVHFQAWMGLHPFGQAAGLVCRSPFIVEFNDLPQLFLEEGVFDRIFGDGDFARDVKGVKGIINCCDGAIFNHVESAGELLYAGSSPPAHQLHFHSYPEEESFAGSDPQDGPPWRLVFAGTLNPSSHPSPAFGDVQLLGLIKKLLRQGLVFHLYLNPYQADSKLFWDYQYLAKAEPGFTLFKGKGPAELPRSIAGYHYGSMLHLFPEDNAIKKDHLRYILPTKFFSYMEAGLPVLVSEELEAVADLVREHGLGLVLSRNDLCKVSEMLRRKDCGALRENVRAFRSRWKMSKRIDSLEDLYEKASVHRSKENKGI